MKQFSPCRDSMTEDVSLLAGLPGCGKTTRLCHMCRDGWLVFDDFKADAFHNSSEFRNSRKFRALISAIQDGLRCAVADIDFCKEGPRKEASQVLLEAVPSVKLRWHFFENDLSACEVNVKNRNRPSLETDLKKLHEYSGVYCIPQGADVLPIHRAAKSDVLI